MSRPVGFVFFFEEKNNVKGQKKKKKRVRPGIFVVVTSGA